MKMRAADYVARFLADKGVRHVFLVTGGGAMHLNDAFGRCKGMEYVPCHHEQACAIAAESYYRMSGRVAAVNVTTGPGGTNALTGVYGAYVDSMAMFVVSGQVKWETTIGSTDLPLRQLGDQEIDIISVVKPVTKYAVSINDISKLKYHLEKAWSLCQTGRPGPVWLDIPMNIQGAMIDPAELQGYQQESEVWPSAKNLKDQCQLILKKLSESQRPAILVGGGIRVSGQHSQFLEFAEELGIPVCTAWNAHDVIWNSHPQYCGRPGTVGDRPGNFAVQNADFLLVLGSRLNIRQISYNWKAFARSAYKVMVDVDAAELAKPTLQIDLPVHAALQDFFKTFRSLKKPAIKPEHLEYLAWCKQRVSKYPVVLPEYRENQQNINPYVLIEELFAQLQENQKVVSGDGTACVVSFQAANLKRGQRLYTNSGCASMGYDLPAAIGASMALDREEIVCLAGDGSIMMNLQELQTIRTLNLPIRIFIFNNRGYHSIRQTQQSYFPDNIVGCGVESKLTFPDFKKIAQAFDFSYFKINEPSELATQISETLKQHGPTICEVAIDLRQQFAPKLSSRKLEDGTMISAPLEDLAPFLSREELAQNLLIPAWGEQK